MIFYFVVALICLGLFALLYPPLSDIVSQSLDWSTYFGSGYDSNALQFFDVVWRLLPFIVVFAVGIYLVIQAQQRGEPY